MKNWTKEKPIFTKECLLLTACWFKDHYEYSIFQIKKVDFDDKWYWGWLTGEGEEYGDLADLKADLYCAMPLINK
jgi:hypothetical protein